MRNTVVNAIHAAARTNSDIVFLTADIGYSVIEPFQIELPAQVVNVGICEQNMIGVAAGMALAGKKVFVYTIVPFATMRCFEQIRVDMCYQNLDVTIVGVGGGFAYGTLGTTHFGLEDLALMRVLPNMKIVAPCDPTEAAALVPQILSTPGPWYVRLNRGGEKEIAPPLTPPIVGQASCLKKGSDVTLFSIGAITEVVYAAAQQLVSEHGIDTEVVHIHTLKPLDRDAITSRAASRKAFVTVEEHMINGGLGSAVCEVLAEHGISIPFFRMGMRDRYAHVIGKQDFLRAEAGLSKEAIVQRVLTLCKR